MLNDIFNNTNICGVYELYELMIDLAQFGLTPDNPKFNRFPILREQYQQMITTKKDKLKYSKFLTDLLWGFFYKQVIPWFDKEYPKFADFYTKQGLWNSNYIADYDEYRGAIIQEYMDKEDRPMFHFFTEEQYDQYYDAMKVEDPIRYEDWVECGFIPPYEEDEDNEEMNQEEVEMTAEEKLAHIFMLNQWKKKP
jgi:hypothetical protein